MTDIFRVLDEIEALDKKALAAPWYETDYRDDCTPEQSKAALELVIFYRNNCPRVARALRIAYQAINKQIASIKRVEEIYGGELVGELNGKKFRIDCTSELKTALAAIEKELGDD